MPFIIKNNNNTKLLVTMCYGAFETIKSCMLPRFVDYCLFNSSDLYLIDSEDINNSKFPKKYYFNKMQTFKFLADYSSVFFIDFDCCILNMNIELKTLGNTLSHWSTIQSNRYKDLYVRSFLFGADRSLYKYSIHKHIDEYINQSPYSTVNYNKEYDEECYLTDIIKDNNIQVYNIQQDIKLFETQHQKMLTLEDVIYDADIIHFAGYSAKNMLSLIPEIVSILNDHIYIRNQEVLKQINKKIMLYQAGIT